MNTVSKDIRMHGFTQRARVEEAVHWVEGHAVRLAGEDCPIERAGRRVLAEDVHSGMDVPSFDRSAMDGYAVTAAETVGAGDYNPIALMVRGQSMPGAPFSGRVASGEALRIMTGAPMPAGADAVVPAEYAQESGGVVEITLAVSPGKHVGRTGEDVPEGGLLMSAGRRLRPQDLGLLASVGRDRAPVVRRPRVRILITGNELVAPGQPKGPHQIYDANSSMLQSLVMRDGGELEPLCRLSDNPESIRAALLRPGADLILVSGGSSVGAEDHAPRLLAEFGEMGIHGIAMRPSSPAGMGRIGDTLVFLLPGNPVSCLCAYDFFAGRALRLQAGRAPGWPYRTQHLALVRKIASAVGRVDYCRVRLTDRGVEPLALSGAAILSSTTRADGFVVVPEESEGYAPGTELLVHLYEPC